MIPPECYGNYTLRAYIAVPTAAKNSTQRQTLKLILQEIMSEFNRNMLDPPFRPGQDPPKDLNDPVVVTTALLSPLAVEVVTWELWDLGATAAKAVFDKLEEHKSERIRTALKNYYTEIAAAVTGLDKVVKSWLDFTKQHAEQRSTYGTMTIGGKQALVFDSFRDEAKALDTFRKITTDDNAFGRQWSTITKDNASNADRQAALEAVDTYRQKVQDVCQSIKNDYAAMGAAGLSNCQGEISAAYDHRETAKKELATSNHEDEVPVETHFSVRGGSRN